MIFIVKKDTKQFLSVYMIPQFIIKNVLHFFFQPNIRKGGKSINFEDKKINKSNFYKNKKLFNIHDLGVNKILVSEKNHMAQKIYLNTLLDIMIGYVKNIDSNKTISFKVDDNKLLKTYNKIKIWEKN